MWFSLRVTLTFSQCWGTEGGFYGGYCSSRVAVSWFCWLRRCRLEASAFRVVSSSDWHKTNVIISPLLHIMAARHCNDRNVTVLLSCSCLATCFCTRFNVQLERLHSAPLPRRPSFTPFGKAACPPSMHSWGPHYEDLPWILPTGCIFHQSPYTQTFTEAFEELLEYTCVCFTSNLVKNREEQIY